MQDVRATLRTPVGRGFALMALATMATGFAMAANQNIGSNYFKEQLHLSGPQFGYITASVVPTKLPTKGSAGNNSHPAHADAR